MERDPFRKRKGSRATHPLQEPSAPAGAISASPIAASWQAQLADTAIIGSDAAGVNGARRVRRFVAEANRLIEEVKGAFAEVLGVSLPRPEAPDELETESGLGARSTAAEEGRLDRLLAAVAEVRDGLAKGLAHGFAEPRRER